MSSDSRALRRYHAGVERALGLFDASNEWADYIAFLSRLAKALQASPPNADVPLKPTLAKYLAQCLKPSLPSGVHQKALEVYSLIFSLLGRDGLSRDLAIWLPGMSHSLAFASLTTRPLVLALYDQHILQLPTQVVRPALKAIILSLLPGIEEENSEDFERSLRTFNRVREMFAEDGAEELFWQSLFLASITSVNRRTGVLVYLTRFLPMLGSRRGSDPESANNTKQGSSSSADAVKAVTTPEPGLLVRCFATGLQDEQPLIQRGFLDLLVSHLPLDAPILESLVSPNDLDILVASAMTVVLRRDMSLNRRLWTWFSGKEDKRENSADLTSGFPENGTMILPEGLPSSTPRAKTYPHDYFPRHGLQPVIRSLQKMATSGSLTASDRARPFRIMLSLMDRWAIGGPVVEAMFVPVMTDFQSYQTAAPSQAAFDEVFRSANVFFDSIEPRMVASQLYFLLGRAEVSLVEFIISNFNLQEAEMARIHIPLLCLAISDKLVRKTATAQANEEDKILNLRLSKLLDGLLSLLPSLPIELIAQAPVSVPDIDWATTLRTYYETASHARTEVQQSLPSGVVAHLLLRNLALVMFFCLRDAEDLVWMSILTSVLVKALTKTEGFGAIRELNFVDQLCTIAGKHSNDASANFEVAKTVSNLVETLCALDPDHQTISDHHLIRLVPGLVRQFWEALHPGTPQFHVEAVEQVWSLRALSKHLLLVDSTIMQFLSDSPDSTDSGNDVVEHFSAFWTHTRFPDLTSFPPPHAEDDDPHWALLKLPVLHIVDKTDLSRTDDTRRQWLSSLVSLRPLFMVVLTELERNPSDPQLLLLGLRRIHKLVTISRSSPAQRRDFYQSESYADKVLSLCSAFVSSESSTYAVKSEALATIRIVIDAGDDPAHDSLVNMLVQELPRSFHDPPLQSNILDLLQTIFSKQQSPVPPVELIAILTTGISSTKVDANIDKWIAVLCNTLPLYGTTVFFANLLKMTSCFCQKIQTYFQLMEQLYSRSGTASARQEGMDKAKSPERSITNLLAGLEYVLARAHTQLTEPPRSPSDAHGGGPSDAAHSRAFANNRLTIILCMQDTIKVCGQIWAWRILRRSPDDLPDPKSFNYMSSRLRTRTRRILEHLTRAEPQECLETLMGMWVEGAKANMQPEIVLNLMQSLDGARPKFMIPATFNAIYSRTAPAALDQTQQSSLSVDVTSLELMAFLIAYAQALEDDLLEEIWADCTTFLREVLANPMPHRQILLRLLEFAAVLCQKMEKTNFGEEVKMRREMADLCARLFTAIFTIKPGGLEILVSRPPEATAAVENRPVRAGIQLDAGNAVTMLCDNLAVISTTLGDSDRLGTIFAGIVVHITGPALRSKWFPQTVTRDLLSLIHLISKTPTANKVWKKDVWEAYNDSKFFRTSFDLVEGGWLPLMKQLSLSDRTLMTELLSRLLPPATAGLMFGVGATAARTEADKRTQLNLRRVALLLLAADADTFVANLAQILTKVEELLTATSTSSPSSSIKGDVYLLFRAMALTFGQAHLVPVWPVIDAELRELFTSMTAETDASFTAYSQLQGAKLLDLLLLLKPEEFQLHEWLFVTDTVDAIYPPQSFESSALADKMAVTGPTEGDLSRSSEGGARKPWLCTETTRTREDPTTLLRLFFSQLSIHAFEDTYSLQSVDLAACRRDLLADLFEE